ncbi:MAG: single-stranded DNA-binding protein [Calditrichia bacterium]
MSKGTVNKVILIGRLGADPEVRYVPSGEAVANFNLATNQSFKDREGNWKETTDWHRVQIWRNRAEFAKQYLHKGMRVYVEGRIQYREWQDQNGVKKYSTEIVATDLQIMESQGSRPAQEDTGSEVPDLEAPNTQDQAPEEDVPF